MSQNLHSRMTFVVIVFSLFLNMSCSKDSDLFDEYVLGEDETLVEESEGSEESTTNEDSTSDEDSESSNGASATSDFVESRPNNIVGSFSPKSAAEISDPSRANHRAIIENSFDCTNCTFAENLTIEPAGGAINGTGIKLNGAFIENTFQQAFSTNTTFSSVYDKTRLSPETFGAIANDNSSDDNAFSALISQVAYAIGQTNKIYIKNAETVHSRNGIFDMDMNGSIIRTTSAASLSHGSGTENLNKYLFEFNNLNVRFLNGDFDGQNLASRLIKLKGVESYLFDNVHIYDFFAPANAYARATGISIEVQDNFVGGNLLNSTIKNIGAASNGNANDAPFGISKAITLLIRSQRTSSQLVQGCTIENIYGDDAEGFYSAPAFGYFGSYNYGTNGVGITFNDNTFKACQRRALKVNASNCQITNNYIESAQNDWIFSGAQATTVHVFSIKNNEPISNVNVSGNTIKTIGEARNPGFGINDATNCKIENNSFEASHIQAQRFIRFGVNSTQGGLYNGDLSNTVIFRNNQITNFYIQLAPLYLAINGGVQFEGNTQNLTVDRTIGTYWAALRLNGFSGEMPSGFTLKNHEITVNMPNNAGTALFGGVFNTQGQEPKNLTFENVSINYTGSVKPEYAFAYTGKNDTSADFDNSNLIKDCSISGVNGNGAVVVKGSDRSVVIQNSYADNNSPITTN